MMSTKLRIILLVLLFYILFVLVRQVKKRRLDLKYTLAWLILVGVLFILVIFPQLLDVITGLFGISSAMNMLFFCGFCFSLLIIYTLTVAVSRLMGNVKELSQKIALLERQLQEEGVIRKPGGDWKPGENRKPGEKWEAGENKEPGTDQEMQIERDKLQEQERTKERQE